MVSDEHKRRVLAHLGKTEKPPVVFVNRAEITDSHVEKQDGGQAVIIEVDMTDGELETGLFVRIQSWDPAKVHGDIQKLFGRKIEIEIRTID